MAPRSDGGDTEHWGSTHNVKSVLEVDIRSAENLPFEPPASRYLEESLMGLRASPHDEKTRQAEPRLARYVDYLFAIVRHHTEAAPTACIELFWIAMGIIFGRVQPDEIKVFRGRLSHCWHSLRVITAQEITDDLQGRDWALTAIPMVLVQAIYRLLVDGFSFDRAQIAGASAQILDKLMQLTHFETTGFQMQPETARKERRRLFLKYVINSPHISLEDLEKDQKRQELLESMHQTAHDQPLSFGQMDRSTLEKEQFKHLLEFRTEMFDEGNKHVKNKGKGVASAFGAMNFVRPREITNESAEFADLELTEPLGVDRYSGLVERGEEIFRRQLEELESYGGHADEDQETGTSCSRSSSRRTFVTKQSGHFSDVKRTKPESAKSRGPEAGTRRRGSVVKEGRQKPSTQHSKTSQHAMDSTQKPQSKARKDAVLERINAPLPQELRETKVSTAWASPAITRLYGDEADRNVLRKSSSETFTLNMKVPTISRPVSAASAPRRLINRPVSAASQSQQHAPQKIELASGSDNNGGHHGGAATPQGAHSSISSAHRKNAMLRNAACRQGSHSQSVPAGGEMISMETRPISMKTSMQRLETMSKIFRQQAFGEYMKEYDIFTGEKKTRFNDKQLHEEESTYVENMECMVGGPGLRVNPFTKAQQKRMNQVASGSGNKASASQRPKSAGSPGIGAMVNQAAEPPGSQRPVPPVLTVLL